MVGERGMMISGGEKQRLAVARLLLKDPPLLFFDEATSALDTYTEQTLLQNINSILKEKQRTSVFVAHRLRTIYDSDIIFVLREGRVVEQGHTLNYSHYRDYILIYGPLKRSILGRTCHSKDPSRKSARRTKHRPDLRQ